MALLTTEVLPAWEGSATRLLTFKQRRFRALERPRLVPANARANDRLSARRTGRRGERRRGPRGIGVAAVRARMSAGPRPPAGCHACRTWGVVVMARMLRRDVRRGVGYAAGRSVARAQAAGRPHGPGPLHAARHCLCALAAGAGQRHGAGTGQAGLMRGVVADALAGVGPAG
jgi:hypothetical protein